MKTPTNIEKKKNASLIALRSFAKKIKWYRITISIFITSGVIGALVGFLLHKYCPRNIPPIADITLSAKLGSVPHVVDFDGSSSRDDNKCLRYKWTINDDEVSEKSSFRHIFRRVGTYRVELTVKDHGGLEGKDVVFVKVLPPKNVRTLKEALKYYQYQIGWRGPSSPIFKYHKITEVKLEKDSNRLMMKYDYGKGGIVHFVLFESNRSIRGDWIEVEHGAGKEELTFNEDFTEAKGWWNYSHDPSKKYGLRLKRIDL